MKTNLLYIFIAIIALQSCRGDEDNIQQIDQILNIYVKDANDNDLINPRLEGSYTTIQFFDLLAETDLPRVSTFSTLVDNAGINYFDYTAGATRLLSDSAQGNIKTYTSEILVRFAKTVDDTQIIDEDTIMINYLSTPDKFEVSKMWHSNQLVFTKEQGKPNIIKLVK